MVTADGSHTAINQALDKPYHSIHGAYQESQRVYIDLGLLAAFEEFPDNELSIFEMGFGTGLNALMTAREAKKPLEGRVEMDDAYLGGHRPGRRGRGAAGQLR